MKLSKKDIKAQIEELEYKLKRIEEHEKMSSALEIAQSQNGYLEFIKEGVYGISNYEGGENKALLIENESGFQTYYIEETVSISPPMDCDTLENSVRDFFGLYKPKKALSKKRS